MKEECQDSSRTCPDIERLANAGPERGAENERMHMRHGARRRENRETALAAEGLTDMAYVKKATSAQNLLPRVTSVAQRYARCNDVVGW